MPGILLKRTWFALLVLLLSGCSSVMTRKEQFKEVDKLFDKGDFSASAARLEKSRERYYAAKDRVIYYLDSGMLNHYAGNFKESNLMLSNAEDAIDELYTKSISKAALSMILNDNSQDYSGEDYEDVYLNLFKALNYIGLNEPDEALVETRRIDMKLGRLSDKYQKYTQELNASDSSGRKSEQVTNKFVNSALGRFLSLSLYRSQGKMDDARIDLGMLKDAFKSEPDIYNFRAPDLPGALDDSAGVRLSLISFTGKSPEKFAKDFIVHSTTDAVIVYCSDGKENRQMDVLPWPGVSDGLHFKFSVPGMEQQGSAVSSIRLISDGVPAGELQLIESIENAASQCFRLKEPLIYLKSLTRTVIKAILNEKANQALDKQTGGGFAGTLTRLITGALVDATENADLRISRYFPARAYIGDFCVPEGMHSIEIEYLDNMGNLIFRDDLGQRDIKKGGTNILESFCFQ